jgi:hypothetical protein
MAKTFGFTGDELKLLLVAVRQMRRTFAKPRQSPPIPKGERYGCFDRMIWC